LGVWVSIKCLMWGVVSQLATLLQAFVHPSRTHSGCPSATALLTSYDVSASGELEEAEAKEAAYALLPCVKVTFATPRSRHALGRA
jgi:hypothetical protein